MNSPGGALYHLGERPTTEVRALLQSMGLSSEGWDDSGPGPQPDGPALLVLSGDQLAPESWSAHTLRLPPNTNLMTARQLLQGALDAALARAEVERLTQQAQLQERRFEELNRIGTALSAEHDIDRLQNLILSTCRRLTNADGASLWLVESAEDRILRFASTQSHSLDLPYSTFTVPLDLHSMVGSTVLLGQSQMVDDAYDLGPDSPFQWAGRKLDEELGYRTKSMLAVPLRNHAGDVVGAVQLINAKRDADSVITAANAESIIVPFRHSDLELLESITSQAAVALDNKRLLDAIQDLFEGFVKASVTAIESRDPTTYGHSGRVAALTVGLADSVNRIGAGAYRDLHFSPDQLRELRYAALLHDFGKIGVREHILVKDKKLYPAQMGMIRARFAYVQRTAQLRATEAKLALALGERPEAEQLEEIDRRLQAEISQLEQWLDSVQMANEPTVLDEDKAVTLTSLARRTYESLGGERRPLLEPDEFHFLSITRGTLDERERREIESHVTNSYRFLTKIPWTSQMSGIPEMAFGHHEKMDGTGYPRRIAAEAIPPQTRMMTIADIYDALTATDRPYKRAVTAQQALGILKTEADDGKLDPDLLDVFIAKKVYEAAAAYRPDQDLLLSSAEV